MLSGTITQLLNATTFCSMIFVKIHTTSKQEMEEFQIYMKTSNKIAENQTKYESNTYFGTTQILNSTKTYLGSSSVSFIYVQVSYN
jgi:hypothetical protein